MTIAIAQPEFLQSESLSAVTNITIGGTSQPWPSRVHTLQILLSEFEFSSDGAEWFWRFSTDGGSTFKQAGTDYGYGAVIRDALGTNLNYESINDSEIQLTDSTQTAGVNGLGARGHGGMAWLHNFKQASQRTQIQWLLAGLREQPNSQLSIWRGGGYENTAALVDAIELRVSAGNMTGEIRVQGWSE